MSRFAKDFKFAVEAARAHFPKDEVWGAEICAGRGYGVFVRREGISVCYQVKSPVRLNGREIDNDIRDAGTGVMDLMLKGFANMEKDLTRLLAADREKAAIAR